MAIFKRRKPRPVFRRIKEFVWPSMGWLRTGHYFWHRVFRTGDSVYKITAGLACGGAVSWNPFVGTHFIQALLLGHLVRANLVASFVGTSIGNPWTFAFMFWASYTFGVWLCQLFGMSNFVAINENLNLLSEPLSVFSYLFEHPLQLLLPMTLGGYIIGFVYWFLSYAILYYPVKIIRHNYMKSRFKRQYKRAVKGKGKVEKIEL